MTTWNLESVLDLASVVRARAELRGDQELETLAEAIGRLVKINIDMAKEINALADAKPQAVQSAA